MDNTKDTDITLSGERLLTSDEVDQLHKQNSRLVSQHHALVLEKDAKKHWDLFYKRNETRFFKDRHWTTREFEELLSEVQSNISEQQKMLLEVGCGVGNLIYPLIDEGLNMHVYACDLSDKAIELVKMNPKYEESKITAFQMDITTSNLSDVIPTNSIDIVTMIFVLSAINPIKFQQTLNNIFNILKPGGCILFRDYGLYDMAQLRFKPGHKIADNFYMRQDGTRSYYFSESYLGDMFAAAGYEIQSNNYVHRRTINKKEDVDVPRIFIQGKFYKPN